MEPEPRSLDSIDSIDSRLRAIEEAARHRFPTADIEVMLEEIERGRALHWLPQTP